MTTTAKKIDEEAALWAIRLADGPLSKETRRELDAWLSNGPRHHGALIRARAVWLDLDRFAVLAAGARTGSPVQSPRFGRRHFLAAGLAASVLAATGGGWLAWRARGETFASDVGEQREVKLTDGSQMVLNTASKANVSFDESKREVHLLEGEVLFEVAKDRTRPFVVHAGDTTVTAIGTAFVVRRDGARVDVTVTEGVVEITRENQPVSQRKQRVAANQLAVAGADQPVDVRNIAPAETERRLAWRGGMVIFDGEPLSVAVAEINRHSRRRIVINDAALAARPVVGIFRANDIETFVSAASAVLDAQAIEAGDEIELRARSTP
jgi:transmembrane sensor